jgi:DNA-binding MarR family transcriptional regulator
MTPTALISDSRERQSVRLWLELLRCAKTQETRLSARLRKNFGQSLTRFDTLSQLYRAENTTLPVTELANRLLASTSKNITGLIDRMAEDGLVTRQPNPKDRRSFIVSLTDKGRAIFEEMAIEHGHWVCDGFEGLSADELETMQTSMIQLREHLEHDEQD